MYCSSMYSVFRNPYKFTIPFFIMKSESSFIYLLAVVVFIIGIFLAVGNLLRIFPTFPFAGFLVCIFASILFRAGKRRERK